jgi:hypothetical protein
MQIYSIGCLKIAAETAEGGGDAASREHPRIKLSSHAAAAAAGMVKWLAISISVQVDDVPMKHASRMLLTKKAVAMLTSTQLITESVYSVHNTNLP